MSKGVMLDDRETVVLAGRQHGRSSSETSRRYRRIAVGVGATDAISVLSGIMLTRVLRSGSAPIGWEWVVLAGIGAAAWLLIALGLRLYQLSRLSPAEEFRRLVEAAGLLTALNLLVGLFMGGRLLQILSQGWLFLASFLVLILVMATRQAWHKRMGRLRAEGLLAYRTLIVGANDEALRIAETLGTRPMLGFSPVGFLSTGSVAGSLDGLPVLGRAGDLSTVIGNHGIECVFVASSAVTSQLMREATRALRRFDVEVRVSANLTEILSSRLTVQPVGDLLVLSLKPARLSGTQAAAKRLFDLLVGTVALAIALPVWAGAAVLIKVTSRGPVFFRQERVGRGGRSFKIYKFRTMVRGAEALLRDLEARNEASGPLFKIRDDPRITRVGRVLRRYSIDELPQLINVMLGQMSLVGPRPPLPREVATYEDWHRGRLEVRPGITGLWQVRGRSELSFDDYVRLDLFYIENWSILYDLYIMGKTIPAVLFRKGAF